MTVLYFILALIVFLVADYVQIVKLKRSPIHWLEQIIRSLTWFFMSVHFAGGDNFALWIYFVAYHLSLWAPFDIILSLLRGLKWNYVGKTSWLDRLMPFDIAPAKIVASAIGIVILLTLKTYW